MPDRLFFRGVGAVVLGVVVYLGWLAMAGVMAGFDELAVGHTLRL